ncbi:hypothetical protein HARCEL1_12105 [Halococcoides cellulosivorans]|uniref:DUF8165 domain-containing protein n=1 Tax=Halococcoides cellulosivorans TaxID=1679096 RepID=A0A2R4X3W2_9EURY|nr:hypothetical protein HARCEL1_12105 [Halococcoides cellulosivorans]
MSVGHFTDGGGYVDHGDASVLFPVEEINAILHTHRDAELALERTPAESVLVVRPTGLASSYALTQRPITVIEVSSLDDEVRELLGERVDGELSDFELIQVGKAVAPTKNRSLGEF